MWAALLLDSRRPVHHDGDRPAADFRTAHRPGNQEPLTVGRDGERVVIVGVEQKHEPRVGKIHGGGSLTIWRTTIAARIASASARTPLRIHASRSRLRGAGAAAAGVGVGVGNRSPAGVVSASSISSRTSPMSRARFFGSFSRQRRSTRRIAIGVSVGSLLQSGSARRTAASVSETVGPSNNCAPASSRRSAGARLLATCRDSRARARRDYSPGRATTAAR